MFRNLIIALFVCCLLGGCMPSPYYQKEEAMPKNSWAYNFRPVFKFEITDTTAAYQTYFLIRHTQAYPFSNIWVLVNIKQPDSSVIKERINIPLAESTGKWLGRGMGEIWEQRLPINLGDSILFHKKGTYEITMEQNMRVNPLPEVLHAGIRVEKMGQRTFRQQQ